ncbi:transcriptional regulator, partial [Bifidobacterium pseudocatenulatum]
DANAWRHDTEACHLTAGTARCWSRARIRASACVCRDVTFVVELKN